MFPHRSTNRFRARWLSSDIVTAINGLLTEAGDQLLTEADDQLIWES